MKKIIVILVVIVILVIGGSFAYKSFMSPDNSDDKSQESIELTKNGITMLVPGDWVEANSGSNTSIMSAADPNSKNSLDFCDVNVNIEKKTSYNSLSYEVKHNYDSLSRDSNYEMLYDGNVSIAGNEGMEVGYLSSKSGSIKQHKAIWFKQGDDLYVILCSAPQSKFAEEESTFDFIINNIDFGFK